MLVLPVPGGPHSTMLDSLPGRDHPPDRALGAGQVLLADHLVERARAQPVGERRVGARLVARRGGRQVVGEQVGHRAQIGARRKRREPLLQCRSSKIYLRAI